MRSSFILIYFILISINYAQGEQKVSVEEANCQRAGGIFEGNKVEYNCWCPALMEYVNSRDEKESYRCYSKKLEKIISIVSYLNSHKLLEVCSSYNTADKNNVCPKVLMRTLFEDKNPSFMKFIESADSNCPNFLIDKEFPDASDFETYLKTKNPFMEFGLNESIFNENCLPKYLERKSGEINIDENKRKLVVAEYYRNMNILQSSVNRAIEEIAAIDNISFTPTILEKVNCDFKYTPKAQENCLFLKTCKPHNDDFDEVARETLSAMEVIKFVDLEIKNIKDKIITQYIHHNEPSMQKNIDIESHKERIQKLENLKNLVKNLFPWVTGDVFHKNYDPKKDYTFYEMHKLVKLQLLETRKKLNERVQEMNSAINCINNDTNMECSNLDHTLAKLPSFRLDETFNNNSSKEILAKNYFQQIECRQSIRKNIKEFHKEVNILALDTALVIGTVGLSSSARVGKLAFNVSKATKVQRLKNFGLIGLGASVSIPLINEAVKHCDEVLDKLENYGHSETRTSSNTCSQNLPVRTRLVSDLKSCMLHGALASVALALPGAIAIRGFLLGGFSKIARFENKDSRILWRYLSKKSERANKLDNIVSPATQNLYLHKKASKELMSELKKMANTPARSLDALKNAGIQLSDEQKIIIENFEKRFRVTSEMINAGFFQKYGRPLVNKRTYVEEFHSYLLKMSDELLELKNLKEGLLKNRENFVNQFIKSADSDLLNFRAQGHVFFKDDFIDQLSSSNLEQNINNISNMLVKKLDEMPVGISLNPLHVTNTIRLGDHHFHNPIFKTEPVHRAIYLRASRLGAFEAEFNASYQKKKFLSITLDRGYRNLDNFFSLPKKCSTMFGTCGSYSPSVLIRHGIPAISPSITSYAMPEVQQIAYAVQKMLKLPHVKNFTVKKPTVKNFIVKNAPIKTFLKIAQVPTRENRGIFLINVA